MSESPAHAGGETEVEFDQLFETYARFVWRVLGRLGVASSDVADASQEVFLVVHRRLASFEARSSIKSWIYGICLKVAASHRRKRRPGEGQFEETPLSASGPGLDEELERRRARALLLTALEQLDEDKRHVFVLYEFEELSMPEVAEAIGCPLTTAYSRLHAARKQVRSVFARSGLAAGSRTG